ncbi:hypothetical protein FrEUN1fDRAFT_5369 [Parafrankia sp. EUN1f]|nr:hypothetical protein FrEUN1fDRAFT_5369 [Parafrankia sp. EUN1f]
MVADCYDVALINPGAAYPLAVNEGSVRRVQIHDVHTAGPHLELGVLSRRKQIRHRNITGKRTADTHLPRAQRMQREDVRPRRT